MSLFYSTFLNLEDTSILTKTGYYAYEYVFIYKRNVVEQYFELDENKLLELMRIFYVYEAVPPSWNGKKILYFDIGGTINGEFYNYKNKSQTDVMNFLINFYNILNENPLDTIKRDELEAIMEKINFYETYRNNPMTSKKSEELDEKIKKAVEKSVDLVKDIKENETNSGEYISSIFNYNLLGSTRSPENLIDFLNHKLTSDKDFILLKAYFENKLDKKASDYIIRDKRAYARRYDNLDFISVEELFRIRFNNLSNEERLIERDINHHYYLSRDEINNKLLEDRALRDSNPNEKHDIRNKRNRELDKYLNDLQSYLKEYPVLNKSSSIGRGIKRLKFKIKNHY